MWLATTALLAFALAQAPGCLAAPPAPPASDGQSVGWHKIDHGVEVVPAVGQTRRVRILVMSATIFRVIAAAEASDTPAHSVSVIAAPEEATRYDIVARNGTVRLATAKAIAEISLTTGAVRFLRPDGQVTLAGYNGGEWTPTIVDGQKFYAVRQEFNRGTDEGFYGLGQHQNGQMNYNGEDVILAQHNMDIAVPFVLSTRNYGLLWDNPSLTRFGYPKEYATLSAELTLRDATGKTGGLTARYYRGDALATERIENDPNYQFIPDTKNFPAEIANPNGVKVPNGEPVPIGENVRVVWEGSLETGKTGLHKFRFYVGGYFKLWIDDKLVMDSWRQGWQSWYRNIDLPMQAGVARKIRAEWIPDGPSYLRFLHLDPLPQDERHELSLHSDVARTIDYYYMAGDTLDDVIAGYRHLTGAAKLFPKWAYGYWQSRQRYATQDDIVGTVKKYRDLKLPLDAIVQDWRYWKNPAWGSHEFDSDRYPDPKKMIDDVHALKAHLMLVIWAKYNLGLDTTKELDDKGFLYRRAIDQGYIDWVKPGYVSSYYDAYSPEARDLYWRQIQSKLDGLGPDAWWMDNDEPDIHSNMPIDERIKMMGPTAMGPAAQFYNSYPLMHVCGFERHWQAAHPDARPLIMSRSGFAGLQNCASMVWSGDLASTWSDMRDQISAGVNFSMSGLPNWSFDIGGFTPEARYGGYTDSERLNAYTPPKSAADLAEWTELYTRWFEFGAFVPVFRSHGEVRHREIYEIADQGTDVYKTLAWYDELRHRLIPYIYSLAAATYHDSGTLMRGLAMDFPQDVAVRAIADEYMFGPSFLVAPVTQYLARNRDVYLPAGTRWYDFYTGATYEGGRRVTADAPLGRIPLFVKAGAIIPQGPAMQYVDQSPHAPVTLTVYTGNDGTFTLYDDDGLSNGYARGEYARIPIRYDDAAGTLSLGARQGSYPGMATKRTIRIRWVKGPSKTALAFDAKPDQSVEYAGQPIALHRPAGL